MIRLIEIYRKAYGDLPKTVWLLALMTLVNRSGTMVIPFLPIYLTQQLDFTINDAAIIFSIYGIGAVIGSYLGGKLTDKIGEHYVILGCLILSGTSFLLLLIARSMVEVAACLFWLSVISEAFFPAYSVKIAKCTNQLNRARAYSLNRMAINLGCSMGPALGGFLASKSYDYLFLSDCITCAIAAIIFQLTFKQEQHSLQENVANELNSNLGIRPYQNWFFIVFLVFTCISEICFMQFLLSLPIYLKKEYFMSELYIGLLISLNGLLIVLFEMILTDKLSQKKEMFVISYGVLMIGAAYLVLNLGKHHLLLVLMVSLLSFGEMMTMPFMNSFVAEIAPTAYRGEYMGMYNVSFSVGNILTPILSSQVINFFNFHILWYILFAMSFVSFLGFQLIERWNYKGNNLNYVSK